MTEPVKEEELSDAAVGAELLVRPGFQVAKAKGLSFFGEVELAKKAIDPNIDGEGVPAPIRV